MRHKVSIVSECHSKNLGDQAIARSLLNILQPYFLVSEVSFSTLPKYPAFQSGTAQEKQNSLYRIVIGKVSGKLKARIRWYMLGEKKKFADHFSMSLEGSDFVILGGGQLIKNNISLFCEKLSLVANVSSMRSTPFSIVGVGVDKKMNALTWFSPGKALKEAKFVILRDCISRDRVDSKKMLGEKCRVLPDLAFSLENPSLGKNGSLRKLNLAINIMNLDVMRAQHDSLTSDFPEIFIQGLCQVIESANRKWPSISLFTTGSSDDLEAANKIRGEVSKRVGVDLVIFHPNNLDELLQYFVTVDHVIATRMHAGILAYISGCNPLCVSWDDKVEGVWSAIRQKERTIDLKEFEGKCISDNIISRLKRLKPATHESLESLAEEVRAGVLTPLFHVLSSSSNRDELLPDASE